MFISSVEGEKYNLYHSTNMDSHLAPPYTNVILKNYLLFLWLCFLMHGRGIIVDAYFIETEDSNLDFSVF